MLRIFKTLFTRRSPEFLKAPPRRRIDLGAGTSAFSLYAIGDVHGRLDLLLDAERKIMNDLKTWNGRGLIIMLGDYIDRGPNSAGVISHLLGRTPNNLKRICICGNHESAFQSFMRDPLKNMWWLDLGGRNTLLSYGIDPDYYIDQRKRSVGDLGRAMLEAIPPEHKEFLENLPISVQSGKYFFVHAGVRPGIPLDEQSEDDLMWIREPFLSNGPGLPMTVVHGHTPVEAPRLFKDRIGIDTGAVNTGRLAILKISSGHPTLLV